MKHHRIAAFLLSLLLCLQPVLPAAAEDAAAPAAPDAVFDAVSDAAAPALDDRGVDLLVHSVHYPVLTLWPDEDVQASVNEKLLAAGSIEYLLTRLPQVMSMSEPLQADYRADLTGDILTCAMSALGPVYDGRPTQVWSAVNVDLRTGRDLTLADLFEDEAAARDAIETYLLEEIAPTLSPHLQNSSLTPLPECFTVSAQGLTLYYPISQLSTLSGRAGTVTLHWGELQGLKLDEGSVLSRIGAAENLTLDETSLSRIADCVQGGALPGIPVTIGGSLREATDTYRMLIDPDLCEAGRMFCLEDGAFRNVYLLTDSLSKGWDTSVIQGIRADSIDLCGLSTGVTTRDAYILALGEPDFSVTLDESRAEAWRLPEGVSDYYVLGNLRLRLHADASGVLRSVFLTP